MRWCYPPRDTEEASIDRSIHKTIKSVFEGKSATEIDRMIEEGDPDVEELRRKRKFKEQERQRRAPKSSR